ncbi:MAG: TlyA family RNA methyltransferase [Coriobacteriales bacterium]|jgi:23S rRNA (cytidine1920-2'-O)/16S rRNA (cytidine1409-2'-O)-methyltransferase|nr:TlyA family RNA methyltransferase [Coriobacteriales bacterium]
MSSNAKIRLAELLVARGLCASVAEAERVVRAGEVHSPDALLTQPGVLVDPSLKLTLKDPRNFVSRGGDKLASALGDFCFDPWGMRCLDVGASTGGFTHCLLQARAASVVAVDVAYGQFAWQLRNDGRVTVLERTNIRDVEPPDVDAPFDLVVVDVSFTPLHTLFAHLVRFLDTGTGGATDRGDTGTGGDSTGTGGTLIALVKPQFELAASQVGTGGVVTDPSAHVRALTLAIEAARDVGLAPLAVSFSPLKGPKGNIEFFLLARRGAIPATIDVCAVVQRAHERLD